MASKFRALLPAFALTLSAQSAREYFVISVIDEATGRGVPLVRLSTTNHLVWYTDSSGLVALNEPGLTGRDVYFHIESDGYEYAKDGFDYRGKGLKVTPGGSATLKLKRTQIAERLYRVTGEGIYRDTVLAGRNAPTGPWAYARQILRHEHYNFYWPGHDPYFDQEGGRVIYFEGTYTASFSAARFPTPRYDYNQIMYRLRLDDERLNLPAPVYRMKSGDYRMCDRIADWSQVESIAWFALPGRQDGKRWENPYAILPVDRDARRR